LPLGVLFALTSHAFAEPNDLVARPLVLAEHQVDAELVTEINLAPRQFAEPTSLAPDVWVGVLPQLTVGLIHSDPSVDRFSPGATFCVRTGAFCQHVYRGSGIDALYSVRGGALAVAPRLRFLIRDVDPVKPALTLGALVRWTHGRFAVIGDPYLQLGLANTERGNRHALWLPVTFAVQPMARWELALRTGIDSDLVRYLGTDGDRHVATDQWHVPLALATRVRIDAHIDVGAMVGFPSLIGPQNTAKERALFLLFGWRS
jgi:hypothetical protein